jgi:hypothetical protein
MPIIFHMPFSITHRPPVAATERSDERRPIMATRRSVLDAVKRNLPRSRAARRCRAAGIALLLALATLPPAGAAADEAFLSFDMPYGGCRLVVRGDGSGTLAYGALPQQVAVPAGSFDLAALRARFAAKARPAEERTTLQAPVGSVRFERGTADLFFNDPDLAHALMQRAWAQRTPPRNDFERDYAQTIFKFCAPALSGDAAHR